MNRRVARLLMAGFLLAACRSGPPAPGEPLEHPLVNTAWRVRDIDERTALDEPPSTLVVESREHISGHAGCNRYFGGVRLDGSNITITHVGSTRMACAGPVMEQEQRFLAALQEIGYWERNADTLLLLDWQGRQRLRFSAVPR
jgi:heat shock protein HslJ